MNFFYSEFIFCNLCKRIDVFWGKEINNNFCTNIETKIGDYILSLVDDKVEVEKPTIQPEPVVEDNNSDYKYRTETF